LVVAKQSTNKQYPSERQVIDRKTIAWQSLGDYQKNHCLVASK
jgi:hypothetical protein